MRSRSNTWPRRCSFAGAGEDPRALGLRRFPDRGQLRAGVSGLWEIRSQLQRACKRRTRPCVVARLQVRESEVIVVDGILWRAIARALERGNRLRGLTVLEIDPAQCVLP